ncbi:MAG: hypothetical protein ACPHN2_10190 [Sinimarinibacterium flocculans]|uniref:hypothetical protein n=1 Tax=Sinimarinibacterium flocculans TaxID=985250 RepID=UPI003C3EF5C6
MSGRALWLAALVATACLLSAPLHAADRRLDEITDACSLLTEPLAVELLGQPVKPLASNEHIPTFHSQCAFSGLERGGYMISVAFKFMVKAMFDADALPPEQLDFNAGFASGGLTHDEKLPYPGEAAYVFEDGEHTYLLLVTGIDGPEDGAGEQSTLVAHYRYDHPQRPHAQRRDELMKLAWRHYRLWRLGR